MEKELKPYPISVGELSKDDLYDLDVHNDSTSSVSSAENIENSSKELYLALCQAMFIFVSNSNCDSADEDDGKCMPEFLMIKTRPFLKWFKTLGYGDVKTLLSKPDKLREILIKSDVCEKTIEQHKSYVRQIIKRFDT